jgi:hypothetical protein
MNEILIAILREGCPVKGETDVIPWGTPLGNVSSFFNPTIQTWKRWADTSLGMKEVTHTSLVWPHIKIGSLPAIRSSKLQFQQPVFLHGPDVQRFLAIEYYYDRSDEMELQLVQNFGEPFSQRVVCNERDGDTEYEEKIWKPVADIRLSVIMRAASALMIQVDSSEMYKHH